ncbi:MAG: recombination protein RecR [Candidatus Krumholzibacteria bacterium]|nr:recombination protein RecR [Candidatus Krumholzibacteria bacterium]
MAGKFDNGDGGEFQSPALERLVRSLSRLPGLGRKSATRLALHLVGHDEAAGPAEELVAAVTEARLQVTNCSSCGAITEADPCRICKSERRDSTQICIVATPVDILPFEKAGFYRGRYFVLGGLLSPLDGVRAEDLPFHRLGVRLEKDGVKEMIIALDVSVEGETTALYLQRLFADRDLQLTRLATGIPVGGALAYVDEVTLQRAFQFRRTF